MTVQLQHSGIGVQSVHKQAYSSAKTWGQVPHTGKKRFKKLFEIFFSSREEACPSSFKRKTPDKAQFSYCILSGVPFNPCFYVLFSYFTSSVSHGAIGLATTLAFKYATNLLKNPKNCFFQNNHKSPCTEVCIIQYGSRRIRFLNEKYCLPFLDHFLN